MADAADIREGSNGDALVADLSDPGDGERRRFSRADLVFTGVDHSRGSYEVRVFLNNPDAGFTTVRTDVERYAGRFHVFGHGGCYGDVGHCDVPPPSTDPTDLRPAHPLAPMTTYVTITAALDRLLAAHERLETVTMVPITLPPRRAARAPALHLFRFRSVELLTYLTPTPDPQRR
jgi:hypothetical protein